jgi:antitoxin (DNA-binding transcriptional repressor) of toxin-antitoxin stability system
MFPPIWGTLSPEEMKMKFVGVREFREDAVKYLNEGNEIVVMKRKKPIARISPVRENSPEIFLLEIGRILSEAGVSKEEALKPLDRARREIYGQGRD